MKIKLDETTHCYFVNGDIASTSVTELLKRHHISTDYTGVDPKVLENAATFGKAVHSDIENFIKDPKYIPTTPQGNSFKLYALQYLDSAIAEQPLAIDYNGMIVAGTCDLLAFMKDGTPIIADHKNTTTLAREYVSWQVSIYDFMARSLGNEEINGQKLNWKGALKRYCFLYDKKTGVMTPKLLDCIPDREIINLLDCEYHNKIYTKPKLSLTDELSFNLEDAENKLAIAEKNYKEAKRYAEKFRAELLKCFESQQKMVYEGTSIRATYIAPYDQMKVDTVKLKRDFPQVYSQVVKPSKAKGYVKIAIKGENEEIE